MRTYPIFITALTLIFFISSCNSKGSLEVKKSELEKLRKEKQEISVQIAELEKEIAKIDTSEVHDRRKMPVATKQLKTSEFVHYIEIQANAESKQNIQVFPEANGIIERVLVNTGDKVTRGQLLAIIDNEVIQRNLDELSTSFELAITMYERQKLLWDQKIGSEVQYLQAKNQKESLERKMATARSQISKTRLTSPISGTVDHVFLRQGETANLSMPAFRVVNLDDIEVKAEVSETYAGKITKGDVAQVYFPSLELVKQAKIRYVGQVINPGDRTFSVEVEFDNEKGEIKPNTMATLRVSDYRKPDAHVLPTHVIQHSPRGDFIFVAEQKNGHLIAKRVFVQRGRTYRGETEIIDGLNGDERIIVKGYQNISDGEYIVETNETSSN